MNLKVVIVSPGFTSPNGSAFLFPLVKWHSHLREAGIDIKIFKSVDGLDSDADVILVDSKYHKYEWTKNQESIFLDFEKLRSRCERLIYCDTTDSTGSLQVEVFSFVDAYWKSQVLVNRAQYLDAMYGHRIYTDYYHRTYRVSDSLPEKSHVVRDVSDLDKLKVSWNSGLADYSLWGPMRVQLYEMFPIGLLLGSSENSFSRWGNQKIHSLSCRFGINYERETVAWQRKQIAASMKGKLSTNKLSRRRYFKELKNTKYVISPFGLGEITLKDFEVFITGGLLIKPSMKHMITWPNFFTDRQTCRQHSWDLSDFEELIEEIGDNEGLSKSIAEFGQENYRKYVSNHEGPALFIDHLKELLTLG